MTTYEVKPIGSIQNNEEGSFIRLHQKYIPALKALDGFRHIQVLWWFSECADEKYRMILETEQPYKMHQKRWGYSPLAHQYDQIQSH